MASEGDCTMMPSAPISVIGAPPTGQNNANPEGEISTMDALLLGRTRVSIISLNIHDSFLYKIKSTHHIHPQYVKFVSMWYLYNVHDKTTKFIISSLIRLCLDSKERIYTDEYITTESTVCLRLKINVHEILYFIR